MKVAMVTVRATIHGLMSGRCGALGAVRAGGRAIAAAAKWLSLK